jgi:putative thioredoxin
MTVIDVSEADFQQQVVDRSHQLPVVVDFWAEWCAPCRQLGPLLEGAANAREGKIILAKLDTDANQRLAQAFRIQGIPAVKALRDGRIVDEFTGVVPKSAVEAFFDALVPSEADELTAAGDEESLRRAVELEPSRADAAVPLARILYARGESEEAQALLANVSGSFQADGLLARIRLEQAGLIPDAFTALDAGSDQEGIALALAAMRDNEAARDDLRVMIVGELDRLGAADPLARETRRELATMLF